MLLPPVSGAASLVLWGHQLGGQLGDSAVPCRAAMPCQAACRGCLLPAAHPLPGAHPLAPTPCQPPTSCRPAQPNPTNPKSHALPALLSSCSRAPGRGVLLALALTAKLKLYRGASRPAIAAQLRSLRCHPTLK